MTKKQNIENIKYSNIYLVYSIFFSFFKCKKTHAENVLNSSFLLLKNYRAKNTLLFYFAQFNNQQKI